MQAVVYEQTGAARDVLTIRQVPDPVPQPGEVRVRLEWSGINPSDVKRRVSGRALPEEGYCIPHRDGAGVIDQVGEGVDERRVGERVWVYQAGVDSSPYGTAAQYVCVPNERALNLPVMATTRTGAGIGVPYTTAYHALFDTGAVMGKTVLVTGGAGAVGVAAIQLARHAGARVVATVSSDQKARIAKEAGANVVLDYTAADHAEQLATSVVQGIDHVVDVALATNISTYAELLNGAAKVVAYARTNGDPVLPFGTLMGKNVDVRFMSVSGIRKYQMRAAITGIAAALEEDVIGPIEFVEFDLADVVEAHETVEQGAPGKVVLRIP